MKKILLALFLISCSAFANANGEDSARHIAQKRLDLAQAMIRAFDQGYVCESDAYPSEINRLVQTAWYNASDSAKNNFLDGVSPDSEMRANLAFRVAIQQVNVSTHEQTAEAFAASIEGTIYYRFGMGAYGSPYNVRLQANGVAKENSLELLDEEPWYRWNASTTTWAVRKETGGRWNSERFLLKIGSRDYVLRQQEMGEIWWQPVEMEDSDEIDYERTLSSSDSFCEA